MAIPIGRPPNRRPVPVVTVRGARRLGGLPIRLSVRLAVPMLVIVTCPAVVWTFCGVAAVMMTVVGVLGTVPFDSCSGIRVFRRVFL